MLLIYLLISFVVLYFVFKYKMKNIPILIGIFLLMLFSIDSSVIRTVINLFLSIITTKNLMVILSILILVYLISSMVIILGLQKKIEKKVLRRSMKYQKFYTLLISMFYTNFDLSNSRMFSESNEQGNIHAMSLLNPVSILFLSNVILLLAVLPSTTNFIYLTIMLYLTNFVAIFWFAKNLINIFKGNEIYDLEIKNPDEVHEVLELDKSTYKKSVLRICLYLAIGIFAMLLLDIGLMYVLFMVCILVFIDLFILAENKVLKNKEFKEKKLFINIYDDIKKLLPQIILLILGIMYYEFAVSTTIGNLVYPGSKSVLLLLLAIVLGMIIGYKSRSMLLALIITLPLIGLINGNINLISTNYYYIFVYIGFIIYSIIVSEAKFDLKNKLQRFDFIYLTVVLFLTYGSLIIFRNIFIPYLILIVLIGIYYLISSKFYKEYNENT